MDGAMTNTEQIKALGLLSGGLDSQLATCVLRAQGIHVEAVVFDSPFFNPQSAKDAAVRLGFPLHIYDFTENILRLVTNPPHGFGSCMNPCIDCHATMLNCAGKMMEEMGFHFLFTGEVLNQRPMSQRRESLGIVQEDSRYGDVIVRPLSAGLLPETKPERLGWVDRSRLLSLNGRGRKPQFALAKTYGITDYPTPAGGCRLTEPNYCRRLEELIKHEGIDCERDLVLLRYGRHFRLPSGRKYILGRDKADNEALEALMVPDEYRVTAEAYAGPTGVLPASASPADMEIAAALCVRYGQAPKDIAVAVQLVSPSATQVLQASSLPDEQIKAFIV